MVEAILSSWYLGRDDKDKLLIYPEDAEHDLCIWRTGPSIDDRSVWYCYPRYNRGQTKLFFVSRAMPANNAMSHSEFLDALLSKYPEDFEWFLWHPEVFDGEYNG